MTEQRTTQQIHDDIASKLAESALLARSEPKHDPSARYAIDALRDAVADLARLQGIDIS